VTVHAQLMDNRNRHSVAVLLDGVRAGRGAAVIDARLDGELVAELVRKNAQREGLRVVVTVDRDTVSVRPAD